MFSSNAAVTHGWFIIIETNVRINTNYGVIDIIFNPISVPKKFSQRDERVEENDGWPFLIREWPFPRKVPQYQTDFIMHTNMRNML